MIWSLQELFSPNDRQSRQLFPVEERCMKWSLSSKSFSSCFRLMEKYCFQNLPTPNGRPLQMFSEINHAPRESKLVPRACAIQQKVAVYRYKSLETSVTRIGGKFCKRDQLFFNIRSFVCRKPVVVLFCSFPIHKDFST